MVNSPQMWGSYESLVPGLVNYIWEGKINPKVGVFFRENNLELRIICLSGQF